MGLPGRFWPKVEKGDGCWNWTGTRKPAGYGAIHEYDSTRKRKTRYAHRVAWEIARGPIPDGLSVLHSCDNPRCVNPDHLFLGDDAANALDKAIKGRAARKLTPEAVRGIRNLIQYGYPQRIVAAMYQVDQTCVSSIHLKKTWWWC